LWLYFVLLWAGVIGALFSIIGEPEPLPLTELPCG